MLNRLVFTLICAGIVIVVYSIIAISMMHSGYLIKKTEKAENKGVVSKQQAFKSRIETVYPLFTALIMLDFYLLTKFDRVIELISVLLVCNIIFSLCILAFDILVVSLLVVGKWRPKFLKIPDVMTMEYMKTQILFQIRQGWPYVVASIILSIVIALFYFICMFY